MDDESVHGEQNDDMTTQTKLIESNEISDKMTKTSSYGAMGNELDVPPVHVCQFIISTRKLLHQNASRTISGDTPCHHCQPIQIMQVFLDKMS